VETAPSCGASRCRKPDTRPGRGSTRPESAPTPPRYSWATPCPNGRRARRQSRALHPRTARGHRTRAQPARRVPTRQRKISHSSPSEVKPMPRPGARQTRSRLQPIRPLGARRCRHGDNQALPHVDASVAPRGHDLGKAERIWGRINLPSTSASCSGLRSIGRPDPPPDPSASPTGRPRKRSFVPERRGPRRAARSRPKAAYAPHTRAARRFWTRPAEHDLGGYMLYGGVSGVASGPARPGRPSGFGFTPAIRVGAQGWLRLML
jgi:hypothetical protein